MPRTKDDLYFVEYWLGREAGKDGWPRVYGPNATEDPSWTDWERAAYDEGYEEGRKLNPTGELRHR